jgi:predicted dehydrogenase
MHYEQALAALTAGKHVMIEKPMAIDLAQSQRLVDEAGRHGLVLSVFHNRRWDRDYLTVKSAIDAGVFGRIINIESRIGQWASCVGPAAREYRPGWRNEAAFGGGGLFDWGSHLIDQLWRLLAPARPLRVFAQLRGNVWSSDCDDFARVLIDFDNGAVGLVEINTTTTYPLPRWHIDGTAGSADSPHSDVSDINTWSQLRFKPAPAGQVEYRSTGAGMVAAGETGKTESTLLPVAQAGLSEVEIWRRFARAIRGQGEPAVTPASVLGTMALLDAARQSSRTGQSVDVSDVAWM